MYKGLPKASQSLLIRSLSPTSNRVEREMHLALEQGGRNPFLSGHFLRPGMSSEKSSKWWRSRNPFLSGHFPRPIARGVQAPQAGITSQSLLIRSLSPTRMYKGIDKAEIRRNPFLSGHFPRHHGGISFNKN